MRWGPILSKGAGPREDFATPGGYNPQPAGSRGPLAGARFLKGRDALHMKLLYDFFPVMLLSGLRFFLVLVSPGPSFFPVMVSSGRWFSLMLLLSGRRFFLALVLSG